MKKAQKLPSGPCWSCGRHKDNIYGLCINCGKFGKSDCSICGSASHTSIEHYADVMYNAEMRQK